MNNTAISLFSSGGIGDLAVKAAGWHVLVANELIHERAEVFKANYPDTHMITGDIRDVESTIITKTKELLSGRQLDLLFATPPCQGMSKNGRGKLLRGIRDGIKPKLDGRNQLILHAVNCINALKPRMVVFENVPEMQNTIIETPKGDLMNILDYLTEELSPEYSGKWEVVEFADYGVPQRRQRLITIFSKDPAIKKYLLKQGTVLPPRTHSKDPDMFAKPWVTVGEAIQGLPVLDAQSSETSKSNIPFHYVPTLDQNKYFWVSNTPPGKGAFDNQCINPKCQYQHNPTHGSTHNDEGINQSNKNTPIRCIKCGELLPRPWVYENNEYRLMSGFTSAYKRMREDLPASALTSNLSYACSDQKIHPRQHRVLSLHEAFILHTISKFEFIWKRNDNKNISDKVIREIIGESIPPKGLLVIFEHLIAIGTKKSESASNQLQPI